MKNVKKLFAVLFAALLLGGQAGIVNAQNMKTYETLGAVGAPQVILNAPGSYWGQLFSSPSANSTWSFGYSNGVANPLGGGTAQTINGTSALTWSQLGPAVTANAPFVYQITQVGLNDQPTVGGGVTVSTTIPYTSSYEQVIGGCSGSCSLTSTPSISTTNAQGLPLASGSLLVITSSATVTDAVIFSSSGTLASSGLKLGAATRSVSFGKTLTLIFNSSLGLWLEQSYGNN